jgi:2-dehydro-3-deoxygluconokinase
MLKLKNNCRYDLAAPTSMGVRITPENFQPVQLSNRYIMQATSAESNVLNISASLGLKTKILTAFVEGSPIAAFIKGELNKRRIEYEAAEVPMGGPWGWRHQFNIADTGWGMRGPRVYNDRAGEVGRTLNIKDFDTERLFGAEGVRILHLSGLIAALSPETAVFCLELARRAKKHGTAVSFDLNYRASFWEGRERELRSAFSEIAALSDILVGNEEDFQLALGINGPEAGGSGLRAKTDGFVGMIGEVKRAFPNASVFATTLREVINANSHLWGAIMFSCGEWFKAEPRKIGVLDRIGGGDGFVGGLLYALLRGYEPEKQLQFGWASGALAVSELNDYATPADESVVWDIWKGNARVKR